MLKTQRVSSERPVKWYMEINRNQWKTVIAGGLGWALDSMDVMLSGALRLWHSLRHQISDHTRLTTSLRNST